MSESQKQLVTNYYDRNTRHFLLLGRSGQALAIHRELWGPGIRTSQAAAAHINDLLARQVLELSGHPPADVADLGCGVGGTVLHLAKSWPQARLNGYTLSRTQATIGQKLIVERELQARCQIVAADFTEPPSQDPAELVLAIESHTHLESLSAFLSAARRHLAPNGLLVIVDDMLHAPPESLPARAQTLINRFKRGWRLGHLPTSEQVITQAQKMGLQLVATQDLSALLRLNRLSDWMLTAAAPTLDTLGLGRYPVFANMIGGSALTQAHRQGIMKYMMLTFRLQASV
jgi:cyclopropane fatty-acyl-phospholipid synthase-like methyltransferase